MKIEHLAIWTNQLEAMKEFYLTYFKAKSNEKYVNTQKEFSSYFLSFDDGARLELMHTPALSQNTGGVARAVGLAHFAISLGSREKVDHLTNMLRNDGFKVVGEPRTTGDGYYESVIADPDGNLIELTI